MSALAFSRRSVGKLFRSHIAEFGIEDDSDATASGLIRRGVIGLPINADVTGTPARVLVPETHPLSAVLWPFFPKGALRAIGRCNPSREREAEAARWTGQ